MRWVFHEAAEQEFEEAASYYDECRPGLGLEFELEARIAIARITEFPQAWAQLSKRTRRCLMNRFPYGVIYYIEADAVQIIAIANLRRKPGYWADRNNDQRL